MGRSNTGSIKKERGSDKAKSCSDVARQGSVRERGWTRKNRLERRHFSICDGDTRSQDGTARIAQRRGKTNVETRIVKSDGIADDEVE